MATTDQYLALWRLEWATKDRRSAPESLTEAQNCFTTKDLSASEGQADTKSTKASENKALDSTCKPGDIEVHQESSLHSRQFHGGQQLSLVNTFDLLHTLQLDYEPVFYQQVHAIATVQLYAFVLKLLAHAAT